MFNGANATQRSLTVMFEPNIGQAEAGVAFVARAPGLTLQFETSRRAGGLGANRCPNGVEECLSRCPPERRESAGGKRERPGGRIVTDGLRKSPLLGAFATRVCIRASVWCSKAMGRKWNTISICPHKQTQPQFGWPSDAWTQIPGRFVLRGPHDAGFQMEKYDTNAPTVIDSVVSYASYIGGSAADQA